MRAAIEEEEYIIATFKVRHPSDGRIALAEEQTRERRRKFERWRAGVDPAVVAGASARMGWVTFGDETPPIEGPSAPNEFMTLIHRPYSSASTGVPVTYTGIRHRHTVRVTRDGTLVRNYDSGTFGAAATRLDTTKWLLYYSSDRIYGDECGFTQALSYHTYTDIGGLTLTSNSHDSQSTCTIVAPSGSTPPDEGGGGGGGGEEWCLYYVVYTPDGRIISQEELYCWIQ